MGKVIAGVGVTLKLVASFARRPFDDGSGEGGLEMEALATLFDHVRKQNLVKGNVLGFLHVLIGRRITSAEGNVVSAGLPWRELSNWLKKVRWDIDIVSELGIDPEELPPKDRQRFWYSAIARAGVDSADAVQAGNRFAKKLEGLGYQVGPAPRR